MIFIYLEMVSRRYRPGPIGGPGLWGLLLVELSVEVLMGGRSSYDWLVLVLNCTNQVELATLLDIL